MPPAFREQPPAGWKEAQHNEGALKGKWWEIYNDSALNALEEKVSVSNQNVLQAEATFREAKAAVVVARAALFPVAAFGNKIQLLRAIGADRRSHLLCANLNSIAFDFVARAFGPRRSHSISIFTRFSSAS